MRFKYKAFKAMFYVILSGILSVQTFLRFILEISVKITVTVCKLYNCSSESLMP